MIAVCSAPRDGGTREFSRLKQRQEDDLSKKGMDHTWRRNVSLESRYGTCRCFPFATSTRIMITSLYVHRGKIHFFTQTVRFFKAQAPLTTFDKKAVDLGLPKSWKRLVDVGCFLQTITFSTWEFLSVCHEHTPQDYSFRSPAAPEFFHLFSMSIPNKFTIWYMIKHTQQDYNPIHNLKQRPCAER